MAEALDPDRGKTTPRETDRFDYVRFTWSDINGVARSKIVPRDHVEKASVKGVGAYAGRSHTGSDQIRNSKVC